MDALIEYIKSAFPSVEGREAFCAKCGTTWGYVKKAKHTGQLLRESVCINFERESNAAITVEQINPNVDWGYLRGTAKRSAA